jgi:hypothetical protein
MVPLGVEIGADIPVRQRAEPASQSRFWREMQDIDLRPEAADSIQNGEFKPGPFKRTAPSTLDALAPVEVDKLRVPAKRTVTHPAHLRKSPELLALSTDVLILSDRHGPRMT